LHRAKFYSAQYPFGGTCFGSVSQGPAPSRRGIEPFYFYEAQGSGRQGSNISVTHDLDIPAYATINKRSLSSGEGPLAQSLTDTTLAIEHPTTSWTINDADHNSTVGRRGIPFLSGFLVCPTVDDGITGSTGSDCLCYSDNNLEAQGGTGKVYFTLLYQNFKKTFLRSIHRYPGKGLGRCANICFSTLRRWDS